MKLPLPSIALSVVAVFAASSVAAAPAAPTVVAPAGAEPSPQGTYDDWSLYTFEENGKLVCYLASRLQKSSDTVPGRGPAYILITSRPAEGKKGVVSVVSGYQYEKGSQVLLSVGHKQFHLFTDRDTAWAEDAADAQIVAAIHGGSAMVVTGRAKNGPATTDTYSLKGAAGALAALDMACPLPGGPAVVHRKKKAK